MAQEILNWEYKKITEDDYASVLTDYEEYAELVGVEMLEYRRHTILYDFEKIYVESEEDISGYWQCDCDLEGEEAFKIGQAKVDELILNKPSPGQLELNYEQHIPQP